MAVTTSNGELYEADCCVLAAPLPAVRAIEFVPGLPADLVAAIGAIGNCPVGKVMLRYRTRFWRRRGFSGDLASDLDLGSAWEATDQQPGRSGVLIAYAAGRRGSALAKLDQDRRIARVRRDLGKVYPGSGPELTAGASACWPAEPFSGGAWAVYRPRQVIEHWPVLHGPASGPIHLAGEHTARLTGYMEGAICSGSAVARLIAG